MEISPSAFQIPLVWILAHVCVLPIMFFLTNFLTNVHYLHLFLVLEYTLSHLYIRQ